MSEEVRQENIKLLKGVVEMMENEDDNLVGFVCSFAEKDEEGTKIRSLTFGDKVFSLWLSTGLQERVKNNSWKD